MGRRDHLRGLLLALAFFWHGVAAMPSPKTLNKAQLQSAVARQELARWLPVAQAVGIAEDPEGLGLWVNEVASSVKAVRDLVLDPIRPWFKWSGNGQGWALFVFPQSAPRGLHVEGRVGTKWSSLYVPWDSTADFLRPQLTNRRLRGLFDGQSRSPTDTYDHFVDWVAAEVFAAHPEVQAVKLRLVERIVVLPGEAAKKETQWFVRVRERP